jgi:hypothetical protein
MYLPVYEMVAENPQIQPSDPIVAAVKFTVFNSAILAILNGVIGAFALIAIFCYKNRNLQIRISNLALLLDCIFIGLLFFSADSMSSTLNTKVHYLYGSYLPVITAILLFAAIRYIKRDEALVRSADRLR